MINVRRAEKKDIPEMLNLLKQVSDVHSSVRPDLFNPVTKYTAEDVGVIISDEKTPVFVADDGSAAGYAMCKIVEHKGERQLADIKTLYIDDICVEEKKRGKHIGTALYNAVIEFARETGCYNVTLNVWACNPAAMEFYKKRGLVPQRTTMEKIL